MNPTAAFSRLHRTALPGLLGLLVSAAVACSDAPPAPKPGTTATDAKGADSSVNLGDAAKADTGASTDGVTLGKDGAQPGSDLAVDDAAPPVSCKDDLGCKDKVALKPCEVATCDVVAGLCKAMAAADDTECDTTGNACADGQGKCKAGACTVKGVSCDDGNVCTDDSCEPTKGCQYANNTGSCDDGKACTSGDACTDGKCAPTKDECVTQENDCGNAKDDDLDGAVDCDDSDCAPLDACKNSKETDCGDKADNDKDGKIDCADADCGTDPGCVTPALEKDCANKLDDDGDKSIDCDDNDCAADAACAKPTKEADCANKIDDDQDAKIDCQDSDCTQDAACKPALPEANCTNKIDDDQDGAADCLDNDCGADLACQSTQTGAEVNCANKIDDDKDGKIDCLDTDCAKIQACAVPPVPETNCTNKIDDDKDGKIDCNDADCAKDAACTTKCAHDLCVAGAPLLAGCDPCVQKVCDDDGFCCGEFGGTWDEVCVKSMTQLCGKQCGAAKESDCKNKVDDDLDGMVDCTDNDCAADLACAATGCVADGKLACGGSGTHSNGGPGSTNKLATYACADGPANNETGPEYAYTFEAECDGALTVTVQKTTTKTGFLDLFVLDGAKGCAANTCLAHGLMNATSGTSAVTVKDAKKGQKYIALVDGFAQFTGDFSLKVACGCAGGKEVACGDKLDNDGDTLADCADNDCAVTPLCTTATETVCADKIDNDKDGTVDCSDADCAKDLACQSTTTEQNCIDKVDNDKDAKIDCADTDCAKDLACTAPPAEADCKNKLDDDKDGKIDCLDPDCAKDAACVVVGETNCTDKVDNDKDGKADCLDVDCIGNAACTCKGSYPLACGASDSWTSAGFGSTKVVNHYVCSDGIASNQTGAEYTYDYTSQCDGTLTVTVTRKGTTAGFLDLFVLDAAKGCNGSTCLAHAAMINNVATKTLPVKKGQKLFLTVDGYQNFAGAYDIKAACKCTLPPETKCANKLDDDKDGQIDCLDTDCAKDLACTATPTAELNCTDKIDNDKDGKLDCLDTDCAKDLACTATPTAELNCTDKLDNDKDGKLDCLDTDCAKDAACAPVGTVETKCTDKLDDDKDGKIDCADSDCVGKAGCVCTATEALACGGQDKASNGGAGSTKAVTDYTCGTSKYTGESGPEYAYSYTASCDGLVTATVKREAGAFGFLDLFVLDAATGKPCAGSACVAGALMLGDTTKVTFQGKKGAKYALVVDGFNNFTGNYTIGASCACALPPKEVNCADKKDDDGDGKIDCLDTDCAGDPACAGAKDCKDDLPLLCGGTDDWNNSDDGSTKVVSAYQCTDGNIAGETGPEYSYAFVAECTGQTTVKLQKTGFFATALLDIFILDGDKACNGAACLAHELMDPFAASVQKTFATVKGKKYHVVVDGYQGGSADYAISVNCVCPK